MDISFSLKKKTIGSINMMVPVGLTYLLCYKFKSIIFYYPQHCPESLFYYSVLSAIKNLSSCCGYRSVYNTGWPVARQEV